MVIDGREIGAYAARGSECRRIASASFYDNNNNGYMCTHFGIFVFWAHLGP